MLKINTDKQTVQRAIAKVQEALANKNKEKQPKEREKSNEKDEVKVQA